MKTPVRLAAALTSAVLFAGAASAAGTIPDRAFLAKALKGDNSEFALGTLAAKRGGSAGTREFGRMLAQDHGRAAGEVRALAKRMHAPTPSVPMPEATAEYRKLQGLKGAAFDAEFARYMVEDHEKDIADYKAQAVGSRDPQVKALARRTLPVLKAHLATAHALAGKNE